MLWLHPTHTHIVTRGGNGAQHPARALCVTHKTHPQHPIFPSLALAISYLISRVVLLVNLSLGGNLICHLRFNFLPLSSISKGIFDVLSASLQLYLWLDCTTLGTGVLEQNSTDAETVSQGEVNLVLPLIMWAFPSPILGDFPPTGNE